MESKIISIILAYKKIWSRNPRLQISNSYALNENRINIKSINSNKIIKKKLLIKVLGEITRRGVYVGE